MPCHSSPEAFNLAFQKNQAILIKTCFPRMAKAVVVAESDCATTTVIDRGEEFIVDEPVALGGKGTGPSPLAHFLGSLIGCTQITLHTIAKEQRVCLHFIHTSDKSDKALTMQ